jgi:hypothetical protein
VPVYGHAVRRVAKLAVSLPAWCVASGVCLTTLGTPLQPALAAPPPPTVAITLPADGSTIKGTTPVTAQGSAGAGDAVSAITFYDGANTIGSASCQAQPTCTATVPWRATGLTGQHTLTARIFTTSGQQTTSSGVAVVAVSPPPDVAIHWPATGAVVKGTVEISVEARSDPALDDYPTSISLYDGANTIGSVGCQAQKTCAGSIVWRATGKTGTHALVARAYTNRGVSASSPPTEVTVVSPAPKVRIVKPLAGARLRGTMTIAVTAATDPALDDYPTTIAIFDGSASIGSVGCQGQQTCAGSVKWRTVGLKGRHVLTAVVHTNRGVSASSRRVVVGARGPHRSSNGKKTTHAKKRVSRRARVSRHRALRLRIGSTVITGAKGSFSSDGTIVVTTDSARLRPANALRAAGDGIRVRFLGTRLRKPLKISYRVGRRPTGFAPRVAHLADDGRWDIKRARLTRGHRLEIRTRSFSYNVPAWLQPKRWVSNLKQWAKDAGNWVASGLGGRTSPLTNCGAAAPPWFGFDKASDLVHVCSIDNAGRAEIQLKSNRGITVEVDVPGNPAYVWVEDQPWWLRTRLRWNANQIVLLGPGQRMTVGYDRPSDAFSGDFRVADDTWRAFLDDAARDIIDQIDEAFSPGWALTYVWPQCITGADPVAGKWVDPPGVAAFVECMFQSLTALVRDPEDAVKVAQLAGGDKAGALELVKRARALTVAGRVLDFYPELQATAIHDIDDSLRALLKGGNDRVTVSMTGSGVPSSPSTGGAPPPSAILSPEPSAPCNGADGTSGGGAGRAGFHIGDSFYGGTWARTDPCDGVWHSASARPRNAAYWYPNGLGVAVDCARDGATYVVHLVDGRTETWSTWFHATDGKWFPSAAANETTHDGPYGLPSC